MSAESERACWVCESRLRRYWVGASLSIVECRGCAHLQAEHRVDAESRATDYHLGYEQDQFVQALSVTRKRQAQRILEALDAAGGVGSILDFGCGRGWLIEEAKRRGLQRVAGADVSDLALGLLREQHVAALKLDEEHPFERLDFATLGFVPEALCFLDVLEHFSGDLSARLRPWFDALPRGVRRVVIKVPTREGLMFGVAATARRLGVSGPANQLFQAGTFPPHYQYFSRDSLRRFVKSLGLEPLVELDDLDFEPALLAERVTSAPRLLKGALGHAGRALGAAANALGRQDTRIVIAQR